MSRKHKHTCSGIAMQRACAPSTIISIDSFMLRQGFVILFFLPMAARRSMDSTDSSFDVVGLPSPRDEWTFPQPRALPEVMAYTIATLTSDGDQQGDLMRTAESTLSMLSPQSHPQVASSSSSSSSSTRAVQTWGGGLAVLAMWVLGSF